MGEVVWAWQGTGKSNVVAQFISGGTSARFGGGGAGSGGSDMTDISREEVIDKIALSEAKTDTKFAELSGTLKVIAKDIQFQTENIGGLKSSVENLRGEVREDYKATRTTIIVTAIGSVLAILGIMLALQGNVISAFQTGMTATSVSHPQGEVSGTQPPQDIGSKKQP